MWKDAEIREWAKEAVSDWSDYRLDRVVPQCRGCCTDGHLSKRGETNTN